MKPAKRQSLKVLPWLRHNQKQALKPTKPWAISTLSTSWKAGRRSTVKLRSIPVTGSPSPNGDAKIAGNQKLQARARAVAEARIARLRLTLKVVSGQRSKNTSNTAAIPITSGSGNDPSTGKLLNTMPLKGSCSSPRA